MIIPFPYEIINRYYKRQIYTHDIIISIKLAFDNAIINTDNIHNLIKIIEYNNLLFGCYDYIEIWINNYIKYVINEPGYYSEIDNLYYIDLMSVFDNFFNQIL
jgi:hypothetical protein